jgi:hypothetical protein
MAASRSVLEALLARVQKRAAEPRPGQAPALASIQAETVDTMPPARSDAADDDIEEYDEELIEIIDDAEVIPQAAAAARAIEPAAYNAALDRRAPALASVKPHAAAAASSSVAPAIARPIAGRSASVGEPLRPESVSARPIAATDIAVAQGKRRELRATSFLELLDASLKLGS